MNNLIGVKIKYTSDIVAVVTKENSTHVNLLTGQGSRFVVDKRNIDWTMQIISEREYYIRKEVIPKIIGKLKSEGMTIYDREQAVKILDQTVMPLKLIAVLMQYEKYIAKKLTE